MLDRSEEPVSPTRVLLADPCTFFRAGLRGALESVRDCAVVGEASTGAETLEQARTVRTDVALIDVHLPDAGGVAVCRELILAHPGLAVLALSCFDWDVYLVGAWQAGVSGFLLKSARLRELTDAIRQARTRQLFTPQQLRRVRVWERDVADRLGTLGVREWEVLWLVAAGKSNREIAGDLVLSENTVEKHIGSLLRKLDVRSRTGLLAFFLEHHLDWRLTPNLSCSCRPQPSARRREPVISQRWIPVMTR